MMQISFARPAALALLTSAAFPLAAQETVAPPTLSAPAPQAPAAEASAAAPAAPTVTFAPPSAVVQTAPPPAPPPESVRVAPTRSAARAALRAAAAPVATAPAAAVAVAPTPVAQPAPVAEAAPPPPVAEEPAAAPAATASEDDVSSTAAWALLGLVGVAIIGLIAFLVSRRRRAREEEVFVYDEPVETYVEPAPLAAAPVAAVEAALVETERRPWIDIGLRPVRAEGDLEVEVTVSNSGNADAHDVRVSTWMLGAGSSDNEQALIDARGEAQRTTLNVAEGDDRQLDATLPLPSDASTPLLVAEARYPLPDGGEGRIAATFEIDTAADEVEARLHEVIERA